MSEITVSDGVLQYRREQTRWLSTGWRGGYSTEPAAHNVSVPEQWEHVDLDAYAKRRREHAGFETTGPTLFTGVDLSHARGARCGPVEAVTTAGLSNPATLPMNPKPTTTNRPTEHHPGTVNIILTTSIALTDGALTTLLSAVVEAKTATLLATANVTGTTTDAVVVGCDRNGEKQPFAGSATTVGATTRAAVRESVRASLASRYAETLPTPETASYGVTTTHQANVFEV